MLELVDLTAKVDKAEFGKIWSGLRVELGALQRAMRDKNIPTIIVLEGWNAGGKGRTLNRLMQALDPRGFSVYRLEARTEQERRFPELRRFWLRLPPDGHIAVFDLSWYHETVEADMRGDLGDYSRERAYERIRIFERQLKQGGYNLLKFFFHIDKAEQTKRLKNLRKKGETAWKATGEERRHRKRYDDYLPVIESMLRETSTAEGPWNLVPATNHRFAALSVAEALEVSFQNALANGKPRPEIELKSAQRRTSPLDMADLSRSINRADYDRELPKLQKELRRLQHLCFERNRSAVFVYEGWDTAGKGGNIRRLTKELDPRGYVVVPVAAPEGIETKHHYLWRFWRALPEAGHWSIYDRSWYGRVLVERVEGFATTEEWSRSYREINEFEEQIFEFGAPVFKFWIHISPEEQLRRLEERQNTPHKHWKVTDEDWRNREKWDEYWHAASDMIENTSTSHAPWIVVEGNDKLHARITVLRHVTKTLQAMFERDTD